MKGLILKHFKLSLSEIRELPDDEYIEIAAMACYLDEREFETIKAAVNQAIATAYGAK